MNTFDRDSDKIRFADMMKHDAKAALRIGLMEQGVSVWVLIVERDGVYAVVESKTEAGTPLFEMHEAEMGRGNKGRNRAIDGFLAKWKEHYNVSSLHQLSCEDSSIRRAVLAGPK